MRRKNNAEKAAIEQAYSALRRLPRSATHKYVSSIVLVCVEKLQQRHVQVAHTLVSLLPNKMRDFQRRFASALVAEMSAAMED